MGYMNERIEFILESEGWEIECESPYEIRHEDGSFATGFAAQIVTDYIVSEYEEEERAAAERIREARRDR